MTLTLIISMSHILLMYIIWLVVWNILYFPRNIGKFIIPIHFHIFQRGLFNHQPVMYTTEISPCVSTQPDPGFSMQLVAGAIAGTRGGAPF